MRTTSEPLFWTRPIRKLTSERFGPDILTWNAASYREYTRQGITKSMGFYIASTAFMMVLNCEHDDGGFQGLDELDGSSRHYTDTPVLGRAQEGAYVSRATVNAIAHAHIQWRNTLFAALLIAELGLITSTPISITSTPPSTLLPAIFHRPAFLQIRFLHRVFTSASIGIAQLGGVWAPQRRTEAQAVNELVSALNGIEMEGGSMHARRRRRRSLCRGMQVGPVLTSQRAAGFKRSSCRFSRGAMLRRWRSSCWRGWSMVSGH